jgi:hypothetical protein
MLNALKAFCIITSGRAVKKTDPTGDTSFSDDIPEADNTPATKRKTFLPRVELDAFRNPHNMSLLLWINALFGTTCSEATKECSLLLPKAVVRDSSKP